MSRVPNLEDFPLMTTGMCTVNPFIRVHPTVQTIHKQATMYTSAHSLGTINRDPRSEYLK